MEYIVVDPLHPIVGRNRNEFFLIEYDSFIVNMSESLIQQSLYHPDYTMKRYPGMKSYWNMNGFARYESTAKFTPFEILSVLNESGLLDNEIKKDIEMYQKSDVLPFITDTAFVYIIPTLQQTNFVKGIHIIKSGDILEHEYRFLKSICPHAIDKDIQFFSGDVPSICNDFSYTSIFMNGVQNVRNLINTNPSKWQDTLFIVNRGFDETDLCEDLIERKYNIRIIDVNYTGIDKLLYANQPMG